MTKEHWLIMDRPRQALGCECGLWSDQAGMTGYGIYEHVSDAQAKTPLTEVDMTELTYEQGRAEGIREERERWLRDRA